MSNTCECGHDIEQHRPFEEGFEVIASTEANPNLSGFTVCDGKNGNYVCECAVYKEKQTS